MTAGDMKAAEVVQLFVAPSPATGSPQQQLTHKGPEGLRPGHGTAWPASSCAASPHLKRLSLCISIYDTLLLNSLS